MNAADTEARVQRLLAGEVDTPVPGSDFDIVLDALRNARIDVGTLEHLLDSANAEIARVNADFDLTASCAARVVVDRDALKARLDAIAAAHTPPPGHTRVDVRRDGRALALDLAPHVAVADVAKDVDLALREAGELAALTEALRAYDVAADRDIPLVAHANALRVAARPFGCDRFFVGARRDWNGLLSFVRDVVDGRIVTGSRIVAGRSDPAGDVLGLSAATAEALGSSP